MIEDTANGPIKPMDSRILTVHLRAGQTLPKVDLVLASSLPACQHPSMGAFAVGADRHVGVEAKAAQQVTEQYSVVFGIATALKMKVNRRGENLPWLRKPT